VCIETNCVFIFRARLIGVVNWSTTFNSMGSSFLSGWKLLRMRGLGDTSGRGSRSKGRWDLLRLVSPARGVPVALG
jgi:hypothetical protein